MEGNCKITIEPNKGEISLINDIDSEKLCWGDEPVELEASERECICLNGVWEFYPHMGGEHKLPDSGFGYIWVPGGWRNFIPWIPIPGIGRKGEWPEFDPMKLEEGWYHRKIKIPEGWGNRCIVIELQRTMKAELYIDGRQCGTFDYEKDSIDITKFVRPGVFEDLYILALEGPGIFGDVLLKCHPNGVHINDVFVKPSVRNNEIGLEAEIIGNTKNQTVKVTARMLDEEEKEEKVFTANVDLLEKDVQIVNLQWNWDNPRLWDIGKPNLYTLQLTITGVDIEDDYRQVFGFREFWIEGKSFFMNGSEIHLRPVTGGEIGSYELINGSIDGFMHAGFNIAEMWPAKDTDGVWKSWYECADRKGFMVSGAIGSMWQYLKNWDKPETRELFEKRTLLEMKRIRNHPSIVIWGTNANVFGSGLGMDPRTLGVKRDHWYEQFYWRKKRVPAGDEGMNIIKKLDPTRNVFTHHGGGVGDVYTLNMYLNLISLQEREEWLTHWVEHSDMPFMVVEFGTPLHVTFMRGRTDFGGAITTEPLLTEFGAIYLGRDAYRMETDAYRRDVKGFFIRGQEYKNWQNNPNFDYSPVMQSIQALFDRNTWRSWRTMGVTGGMIPWNDGHGWEKAEHAFDKIDMGPFKPGKRGYYWREVEKWQYFRMRPEGSIIHPGGKALIENNNFTLAWIAGPEECFTSKDHNFTAGDKINKQAVLINDTRDTQNYSCSWSVKTEAGIVGSESCAGVMEAGKILFLPISVRLPEEIQGRKIIGKITLEVLIGEVLHRDTFDFTVFEKVKPLGSKIALFDPVGKTRDLLNKIGADVVLWEGQMYTELVVIGRTVLSDGYSLPVDLEEYIARGGKAVIFNQDPQWMRENLGLRVSHHISRRVFKISDSHPATEGIDDEDLRDWAGESDLTEAYPMYAPENTRLAKWWFPYHGYHWGNRGGVTSAPVEKPHRSSWRPILECEFDLAYSPLMELDYGKGKLLLCTLDLEEHAALEPAALLMAENIVRYAEASVPVSKSKRVDFIGSSEEAAFLHELGVIFERTETISREAQLLVIGSNTEYDENILKDYIASGGKVFFMQGRRIYKGFDIELDEKKDFAGSLDAPQWEECSGLSVSDLRFKSYMDAVTIKGEIETGANGLLGRLKIGSGTVIFSQIFPESLEADTRTYFRFTRWRQFRAISQILSNMGASFRMDRRIFRFEKEKNISLSSSWSAIKLSDEFTSRNKEDYDLKRSFAELDYEMKSDVVIESMLTDLPRTWEAFPEDWDNSNRDVVFRKNVYIPKEWEGRDLLISLGKLDNSEFTYFNGICISNLDIIPPEPHNYPRVYPVPGNIVKAGENEITIHIYDRDQRFDAMGGGGFCGPADQMYLKLKQGKYADGFYHYDYRSDYVYGDDPYRYFNW